VTKPQTKPQTKPAIDLYDIETQTGNGFPEPFGSTLGPYIGRALEEHFDLTKFGVSVEILPPGSQSALRHWHEQNDELVVMLAGELTLVTEDGRTAMLPNMCVGFKAGTPNGHHLINESAREATFLVVGSRGKNDSVHYPDDDIQWLQNSEGKWITAHKDGSAY
jgi:uncharacterized cupin superfamily protein